MLTLLTPRLLDRFEARLRAAGAPIVDAWAPGLTDEQIDALLQPLGIDLPEEARVWWRWHNGTHSESPRRVCQILPGRDLYPLQSAAEEYADLRDPRSDHGEPEGLLAPLGEQPIIWFQCAGPRDAPVPVYSQNDWTADPRPVLPSIGDLVLTWISYLDQGFFKTNAEGIWEGHGDYPQEVWDLGVY